MRKEMSVSAIREGTVIDHLPSEVTLKVVEILKLGNLQEIVSVAYNLKSKRMKKKGIIKIGGKNLNMKEINKIAMIAPMCTMSIIKDYKVVQKTKLEIPLKIEGVAKCINPNCVTNNEGVLTVFNLEERDPVIVRCQYCERTMTKDELIIE